MANTENDGDPIGLRPRLVAGDTAPAKPERDLSPGYRARHEPPPPTVQIVSSSSQVAARQNQQPARATFTRQELDTILNVYGRMVAEGEWKDYAIDFEKDRATFSVYRRTSEMPIYRIEKQPKLARKQGAYSVVSQTGLILKRGPDLRRVLGALDKRLRLVEG